MARPKRPRDTNQLAKRIVDLSVREAAEPEVSANESAEPTKDEVSKVMAALGRRGGKIGGKRRLETMTRAQRVAVAKKGARAMWNKRREKTRPE
jgi:hypothetical protein